MYMYIYYFNSQIGKSEYCFKFKEILTMQPLALIQHCDRAVYFHMPN